MTAQVHVAENSCVFGSMNEKTRYQVVHKVSSQNMIKSSQQRSPRSLGIILYYITLHMLFFSYLYAKYNCILSRKKIERE